MKIISSSVISLSKNNSSGFSFKKMVDYGAREKGLIYVPILVEEPDSFESKSSQDNTSDNNNPNEMPKSKNKFNSLLKKGGAAVAAVEVLPDIANNAIAKLSGTVDQTTDFANNAMDKFKNVKENYNEKFSKSQNNESKDENQQHQEIETTLFGHLEKTSEDIEPHTSSTEHEESGTALDTENNEVADQDQDQDQDYDY